MHKRPCWVRFFLKFGALRLSKTSFSLERGAKNHMFTKFSLFFRIIPKSYKKPLKMGLEISPKHPRIYHPKMIQIFMELCHLSDPPKWSKMDLRAPLGVSWGLSGKAWPRIVLPSASQGCPRDSPGTPKASISTYFGHVVDLRASFWAYF